MWHALRGKASAQRKRRQRHTVLVIIQKMTLKGASRKGFSRQIRSSPSRENNTNIQILRKFKRSGAIGLCFFLLGSDALADICRLRKIKERKTEAGKEKFLRTKGPDSEAILRACAFTACTAFKEKGDKIEQWSA